MSDKVNKLKNVIKDLIPEWYEEINWGDLWCRPLENGLAFQIATLCSLVYAAKENGCLVMSPVLDANGSDMFLLRNEIPLNHNAQAGNSATILASKPLWKRFFFSLIPKFTINYQQTAFSIFIEGCPYHKIMTKGRYLDRPDIIVYQGEISSGYPKYDDVRNIVEFKYNYLQNELSGELRVSNSPFIPCVKRLPLGGIKMTAFEVVECSVNKTYKIAKEQMVRYRTEFTESENAAVILVTGNEIPTMDEQHYSVDLTKSNLFADFKVLGKALLEGIISQIG